MATLIESGYFFTTATVRKYDIEAEQWLKNNHGILVPTDEDFRNHKISPDEIVEGPQPGNVLTTRGINQIWRSAVTADPAWDSTHLGLAVGTGTSAASSDSDLGGGSKYYKTVSGTATVGAANGTTTTLIASASYSTSVANFAWNEYAVIVPTTSAGTHTDGTTLTSSYNLLNHKASSGLLGTKVGTQLWTLTITMSLT